MADGLRQSVAVLTLCSPASDQFDAYAEPQVADC